MQQYNPIKIEKIMFSTIILSLTVLQFVENTNAVFFVNAAGGHIVMGTINTEAYEVTFIL